MRKLKILTSPTLKDYREFYLNSSFSVLPDMVSSYAEKLDIQSFHRTITKELEHFDIYRKGLKFIAPAFSDKIKMLYKCFCKGSYGLDRSNYEDRKVLSSVYDFEYLDDNFYFVKNNYFCTCMYLIHYAVLASLKAGKDKNKSKESKLYSLAGYCLRLLHAYNDELFKHACDFIEKSHDLPVYHEIKAQITQVQEECTRDRKDIKEYIKQMESKSADEPDFLEDVI
jgi:hypothetical protein